MANADGLPIANSLDILPEVVAQFQLKNLVGGLFLAEKQ